MDICQRPLSHIPVLRGTGASLHIERSAYYWADEKRGGAVVQGILGEVFLGLLIVDGWHAYTKIVSDRQTCMAHIFRKIRAFIDAFPQYRSIIKFCLKLRQIIRDGEKLQTARGGLSEWVFQRRLKALKKRLDELLEWNNPNDTLKDVIKKVRRQKEHILTFVEHEDAPHHNNYGEYIIKKGVVKRKMSGGSMSAEGARANACMQSVAMTCQLRGISFHRFLKASLVCWTKPLSRRKAPPPSATIDLTRNSVWEDTLMRTTIVILSHKSIQSPLGKFKTESYHLSEVFEAEIVSHCFYCSLTSK